MDPIKAHLKKGVKVAFLTKYCDIVIQLIISAILARILSPSDYGLFAIIIIFINFAQLIAEIGICPAIVQNNELNTDDVGSIFIFTIFQGLILALVYYFISLLIFLIYHQPIFLKSRLDISIIIFFSSLTTVPLGILRKKLEFIYIGVFNILANLIGGLCGIFMALKDFGVYSLIYKTIISGILMFFFLYARAQIKLQPKFSFQSVKKIENYCLNQFGFNVINYISRNIDNLLIGKVIGTAPLGIYDRAYKLMMYPIQSLTFVINPVIHPVLSKIRDDKKQLRKTYLDLLRLLSLISIPLIAGLYIYFRRKLFWFFMALVGWSQLRSLKYCVLYRVYKLFR
ncbi:MAG TPA: oligosaccharide flippase family protein [Bacillota bacterium]|nr:oligosaccharide flippase family protein [Bacillota bacterium]